MQTVAIDQPMLFSDLALNKQLLAALDKLGFVHATPVQQQALPLALAHKDLKVGAETGSGKTAAFLLPALHHALANLPEKTGIHALVLAPTRELARQIERHCRQLSAFCDLQIGLITGGDDFKSQQKSIRNMPDILIATPGRLLELLGQGLPDLSRLQILVLDEADRMLDMGFSEDVLAIVDRCSKQRQTMLFSATLNHNAVNRFADKLLRNPETVALARRQEPRRRINQQIILADDTAHKINLLAWLLHNEHYDIALVFTNTRLQADQLQGPLRGRKLRVGVLHGDLDQKDRKRIMALLSEGAIKVLIATDLAARGLDIAGIGLVVNFDVPRNGVDYTHRIGRTGRANETGLAITLVASGEWNLMSAIDRYLKLSCQCRTIIGLEGAYQGPKKLKASGKAAGGKKKAEAQKAKTEKVKIRHRDKKNIGKRRQPSKKLSV